MYSRERETTINNSRKVDLSNFTYALEEKDIDM